MLTYLAVYVDGGVLAVVFFPNFLGLSFFILGFFALVFPKAFLALDFFIPTFLLADFLVAAVLRAATDLVADGLPMTGFD